MYIVCVTNNTSCLAGPERDPLAGLLTLPLWSVAAEITHGHHTRWECVGAVRGSSAVEARDRFVSLAPRWAGEFLSVRRAGLHYTVGPF